MTRRAVPVGVWLVLALALVASWWPLLDARVLAAAQHSEELPDAADWASLVARLPADRDARAPLFVHALRSSEFVWLRLLAYPQRLAALPRGLDPASLRRVLPDGRAWLLLLHAGDAERTRALFAQRVAPREPLMLTRQGEHLLLELPP